MKKDGILYAFGSDNGFRYTHLLNKVNTSDPLRDNSGPEYADPDYEQENSSFIAKIIGGDVGVLFFLGLISWCCRTKKITNIKNASLAIANENRPVDRRNDLISRSSRVRV